MPHVISNRDFSKLTEAYAGKPTMEDVYTKLAEAENRHSNGNGVRCHGRVCICCGINTACEAENTVYLIWLFHGRQEHEKLI